ncbi:MAG: thymidine kinase [Deltaproteobacteria bacterium]|nr:thymidine kinase [Deltaproteobacteria bacterium]
MNIIQGEKMGWVEVITGGMFSGKTEELIRRLRRAQIAKQKVQVFKPKIDNRYSLDHITSHSEQKLISQPVEKPSQIPELTHEDTKVVGIDEAQFFDESIVQVCQDLADSGIRVIVAGLDQDYRGKPFEPMPHLLAIADHVTKNAAVCMVCGNPASRTQKIIKSTKLVEVGAASTYEARCRMCHDPDLKDVREVVQI